MRKKTILWLVVTAIILAIIGFALVIPSIATAASHCTQQQINTNTCSVNLHGGQAVGVIIGVILWFASAVLWLIAWIAALIRSARMQTWAWFVIVLIFSWLGTLIYAFFGPRERPAPTMYPPTSYPPPGYPPPGYPPPPGAPPPYPQT